jgi:AcrR family transcriptional regulator
VRQAKGPPKTSSRRPGRPRSSTVDAALSAAVIEILASDGYEGLRVDDVAERAGVSKTTLYRRAPSKAALVVDVLRGLKHDHVPLPDTGDIASDLRSLVRDLYRSLDGTALGRALAGLLAEKDRDPELTEAIEQLWHSRQQQVGSVIRRGIDAGTIRPGLDEASLVEFLAGPAYYRLLVTGQRLDPASATRHADALVAAVVR